jgi:phenylacetate-coenzyme A ligase PaaK-like adenylate-forming protein
LKTVEHAKDGVPDYRKKLTVKMNTNTENQPFAAVSQSPYTQKNKTREDPGKNRSSTPPVLRMRPGKPRSRVTAGVA